MKRPLRIFKFAFLALVFCSLITTYSCKSLVIKEEDSPSDKTGKIAGRILLGVGTLGLSEETIEDHKKEYEHEKQIGMILRNHFVYTLQAIEGIGKAEKEIALMTREKHAEKIKYHLVIANNLLDSAVDKMKGLKNTKEQGDIAKRFKSAIADIVDKKKQLIKYWIKKERGIAVAYQTLANQRIIEVLDEILQINISNKYIFSQDEIYKIIALREEWTRLTKTKFRFQPVPKQTF